MEHESILQDKSETQQQQFKEPVKKNIGDTQTKYQLLSFRRYSSQYIVQSGQVNDGGL